MKVQIAVHTTFTLLTGQPERLDQRNLDVPDGSFDSRLVFHVVEAKGWQTMPRSSRNTTGGGQSKKSLFIRQLQKPLSQWAHIPVDLEGVKKLVESSAEQRRQKAKHRAKVARPKNSFLLYRLVYGKRARHLLAGLSPAKVSSRDISRVTGASWNLEEDEVKDKYKNLAKIDQQNHAAAFPEYQFTRRKLRVKRDSQVRFPATSVTPNGSTHTMNTPEKASDEHSLVSIYGTSITTPSRSERSTLSGLYSLSPNTPGYTNWGDYKEFDLPTLGLADEANDGWPFDKCNSSDGILLSEHTPFSSTCGIVSPELSYEDSFHLHVASFSGNISQDEGFIPRVPDPCRYPMACPERSYLACYLYSMQEDPYLSLPLPSAWHNPALETRQTSLC